MSGYHALFIIEPIISSSNPFRNFASISMKDLDMIVILFENMIQEFNARQEGFQALLQADLISLVTTLSRLYRNDNKKGGPKVIGRVARTAAWIEENYLTPLSLGQLSKAAHCSACQLIRDFKKSYGVTPVDYILHLRIEHAIQLLKNVTLSITEIAFLCCFSDSYYFSRVFKQRTGLSPRQYRNKCWHCVSFCDTT